MRVGESVRRTDGLPKVRGTFVYSSDLHAEEMLWGATVRSPHPYARIVSIDTTEARAMPGVDAVLTHEDVPGQKLYGLEFQDQPVLVYDFVRYWGESVALVAAEHPEQARRAAQKVRVEYEVLKPVTDAEAALRSRTAMAASTSTSRRNGSTSTSSSWRTCSDCPSRKCG